MKPDILEQQLRESAWRRSLTAEEQAQVDAWLQQHPEAVEDWEAEQALSKALARLEQKPAPSNLVARVWTEIERDNPGTGSSRLKDWLFWPVSLRGMRRAAVMAVVLVAGVLAYQDVRQTARQRTLQTLARTALAMPGPDVLQDMEDICRLGQSPAADMELLALDL